MDVFRFSNLYGATRMIEGTIINGLTSKMWVERYREAGEFKFTAPASNSMRNNFPRGSLISHTDTKEVMIVENHEIVEDAGENPQLVITGRGFETFFENRIVGANKTFPTSGVSMEYLIPATYAQTQAFIMVRDHTDPAFVVDPDDGIPYMLLQLGIGASGALIDRSIKRGTLYERLLEFLAIQDWGIKIIRPGFWVWPGWTGSGTDEDKFQVWIHQGADKSDTILISQQNGDIQTAEYLWSIKSEYNTAIISGRWVDTKVTTGSAGIDRRVIQIDASDIDDQFTAPPSGGDLTDIIAAMQQRGNEALAQKNTTEITRVEVSKSGIRARYRVDYDVGDIISVSGNYNESTKMRISEFVEIEDEHGSQGYPTLSPLIT